MCFFIAIQTAADAGKNAVISSPIILMLYEPLADLPARNFYVGTVFDDGFKRVGNAADNCFQAHRGRKRRFPDYLFGQERNMDKAAFHRFPRRRPLRRKVRDTVTDMVADKSTRRVGN